MEEKEVGSRGLAQNSAGKGEFSASLKRGETLAGGFPFHVAHIKRKTTQRQSPTLRGSSYRIYGFDNPSVSFADSSLCTREPYIAKTLLSFSDRIQRLRQVGDQVGCILNTAGITHQAGGDACLFQLLVGELAVGRGGRVQATGAGIGHMGLDAIFSFCMKVDAASLPPFSSKETTPQPPLGRYFCARS